MTDQTSTNVSALAEAMYLQLGDPFKSSIPDGTFELWARLALQAIQANPDILREYGIGRLPTRSEVCDILSGKGWPQNEHLPYWTVADSLVRSGYALPDPQPPEPTLREQVARMLYSAENPTFKWDSVPSQWHHRRMFDMADTIIGNFDITLKAPRP